jgi:hypothetical protein
MTQISPQVKATATALPPTDAPTVTSTPDFAVLLVPPEVNRVSAQRLQDVMEQLTAQQDWLLQVQPSLAAADLAPTLKLVVVMAPFTGLAELAQGAPSVQFVGVGIPDLPELPNLVSIGPKGWQSDQQAFLAGYIAALTSPDWRGGILTTNTPEGQVQQQAFANGLHFFCGLCKPAYPPYFTYPRWVQIPANPDQPTWSAAVDELVAEGVVTVYVDPALSSDDILAYLVHSGLRIIGSGNPAEAYLPFWVATIFPEPGAVLRDQWQAILAGQSPQSYPMPLAVDDLASGFVTPARERLVQQILNDLVDGLINPNLISE